MSGECGEGGGFSPPEQGDAAHLGAGSERHTPGRLGRGAPRLQAACSPGCGAAPHVWLHIACQGGRGLARRLLLCWQGCRAGLRAGSLLTALWCGRATKLQPHQPSSCGAHTSPAAPRGPAGSPWLVAVPPELLAQRQRLVSGHRGDAQGSASGAGSGQRAAAPIRVGMPL